MPGVGTRPLAMSSGTIRFTASTGMAKPMPAKAPVGATIAGSPAEAAGIQGVGPYGEIGDIIVGAAGEPVRRLADLAEVLERHGVGARVALRVERNGRTRTVEVAVADVSPRS